MYDLVNLSNKEVKYRVMLKRRKEEVMHWRSDHDYYVAAEKKRRLYETIGELFAYFSGIGLIGLLGVLLALI